MAGTKKGQVSMLVKLVFSVYISLFPRLDWAIGSQQPSADL